MFIFSIFRPMVKVTLRQLKMRVSLVTSITNFGWGIRGGLALQNWRYNGTLSKLNGSSMSKIIRLFLYGKQQGNLPNILSIGMTSMDINLRVSPLQIKERYIYESYFPKGYFRKLICSYFIAEVNHLNFILKKYACSFQVQKNLQDFLAYKRKKINYLEKLLLQYNNWSYMDSLTIILYTIYSTRTKIFEIYKSKFQSPGGNTSQTRRTIL